MADINVSICCSSDRPHFWEYYYETVSMNTINFEILFIGPNKPNFILPNNVKFIHTNVKPAQCEFIGPLYSRGELVLIAPDDSHMSPFCLDILYEAYKKENNYKCIVSPEKYGSFIEQISSTEEMLKIINEVPTQKGYIGSSFKDLQTQEGGMISRQFYLELGGPDKRFIFGHAFTDVQIRALRSGGKIVFCPDTYAMERKDLCLGWMNGKGLKYSSESYNFLLYEWVENDKVKNQRTDSVQSFEENDTLLIYSHFKRLL